MKRIVKGLMSSLLLAPMMAAVAGVSPGGPITLVGPITFTRGGASVTCTTELTGSMSTSNGALTITNVVIGDLCGTGGQSFYSPNISSYWTSSALTGPVAGQDSSTLSGFSFTSATFYGPPPPTQICAGSIPLTWDGYGEKVTINPTTITAGGTSCIVSGTLYLAPFQSSL
jgi:hypothetical protein